MKKLLKGNYELRIKNYETFDDFTKLDYLESEAEKIKEALKNL